MGMHPGDRDAKLEVLARLAKLASDDCVIASSSSFIPMSQIAAILPGRERCLVIHPGNPPFLLRIAEICPAPFTDPAVIDKSEALMQLRSLTHHAAHREGRVHLQSPAGRLLREAYALIAEGATNAADIDRLVRDGLGFRWSVVGPSSRSISTPAAASPRMRSACFRLHPNGCRARRASKLDRGNH